MNPTDVSFSEVEELEDSDGNLPIFVGHCSSQLFSVNAPGVNEIHPEFLKALDVVGCLS